MTFNTFFSNQINAIALQQIKLQACCCLYLFDCVQACICIYVCVSVLMNSLRGSAHVHICHIGACDPLQPGQGFQT